MTTDRSISLDRSFGALLRRTRRRLWLHGAAACGGWAGGAVVAAAWALGGPQEPARPAAWGLLLSTAALAVLLGVRALAGPLLAMRSRADLAAALESRGRLGNIVVAAEESLRLPGRWATGGPGGVLLDRIHARAEQDLATLGPRDAVALPHQRRHLAALAVAAGLAAVGLSAAPGTLHRGVGRLLQPWAAASAEPTAGLLALSSPEWVVTGAPLELAALDVAAGMDAATCEIRRGDGPWEPVTTILERNSRREPGRLWTARLDGVREDLTWRFRRGAIVSRERRVIVRDHPLLVNLAAVVTPPAYTGAPARRFEHLPAWIEVPAGSRVELAGEANNPLAAALLVAGSDSTDLAVDGSRLAGALTIARDTAFRLQLRDAWGLTGASPLAYEIAAAADQAPAVALSRPDDDGLLPLEGSLPLEVEAADDFGVAGLRLVARIDGGAWIDAPLQLSGVAVPSGSGAADSRLRLTTTVLPGHEPPLGIRCRVDVEVAALGLAPGKPVEIAAEAWDNRKPGPAGVGRSTVLRFVMPAPSEVLAQQDEQQAERRAELDEARRRSRELDADLDRLTRELMKNPVPDWGRRQEMEEALRRQAMLQQELGRIAEALQQQLDNLASSQLTSEAQLQRADEVAELLQHQQGQDLQDMLEGLEQAGDRMDPGQLADALREAAQAQQDLARRLDAALAMMDRMAREQDLESMTAMLEQMMRAQQELADSSRELADAGAEESQADDAGKPREGERAGEPEAGDPADGPESPEGRQPSAEDTRKAQDLAARQEDLAREMDQLRRRLEEAVERMQERAAEGDESPLDQQARENLEQALAQLQEQMSSDTMDQAAQQLAQMDPQTASQMQQQAMRDLGSLYHVLLQSQQAMQSAMQMNRVASLRDLAADLLAVSARQEDVAGQVPDRLRDVRARDLTRGQHRLQAATVGVRERLSGLMDESPQQIIKLLEDLDEVIEAMGLGVRALEEGRAGAARQQAQAALAKTNSTVVNLLTQAQMSMQGQGGGSGSSSSDPSQQLQDLAREQARLNGVTDELRQMLADRGMSQQMRSQMKRLGEDQAAQAGRVRDLAEQERTRPDGGRLLGDLAAMGDDLETIAEELDGGLVSQETLVRQERILSRMLDARNAARRRDYSTRRESRSAEEIYGDSDELAGRDTARDLRRLRLRYQPLEKAPLEYRDLVRRYFAGLDSLQRLDGPAAGGEGRLP
jgi:hypothetical protein